jgi:hypothetical protein
MERRNVSVWYLEPGVSTGALRNVVGPEGRLTSAIVKWLNDETQDNWVYLEFKPENVSIIAFKSDEDCVKAILKYG